MKLFNVFVSALSVVAGVRATAIALPGPDADAAATLSVRQSDGPQICLLPRPKGLLPKLGNVYCCASVKKMRGKNCRLLLSKGFWDVGTACPNGAKGKKGKDYDYYCCNYNEISGYVCEAVVR